MRQRADYLINAVRQPVIIWLTVPLALVGVVYGLIITQTPMEFVSILALLSLTGMRALTQFVGRRAGLWDEIDRF